MILEADVLSIANLLLKTGATSHCQELCQHIRMVARDSATRAQARFLLRSIPRPDSLAAMKHGAARRRTAMMSSGAAQQASQDQVPVPVQEPQAGYDPAMSDVEPEADYDPTLSDQEPETAHDPARQPRFEVVSMVFGTPDPPALFGSEDIRVKKGELGKSASYCLQELNYN